MFTGAEGDLKKATRMEWTRLTRDLGELYFAIRATLDLVRTTGLTGSSKAKGIRTLGREGVNPIDLSLVTDFELRKNLAYLNSTRNQLR